MTSLPQTKNPLTDHGEPPLKAISRGGDGLHHGGTNLRREAAPQPHQQETAMRELVTENQETEILVLSHEDPLTADGKREHLLVGRSACRLRDGYGIMTKFTQMDRKAGAEVFVDEKPQTGRLSGSGMISSCPARPAPYARQARTSS